MALYHMSMTTISRSAGRSATAAAAYRSAARIVDINTGEVHDYRRKRGTTDRALVLPVGVPEWAADRSVLWNQAEAAERRKNSVVAREVVVALPAELDAAQRAELAKSLARELADRHGCAVDVSIHLPGREGDQRNHHAHLLMTTRRLTAEGFAEKTRELDDQRSGEVKRWRERWAEVQNSALAKAGHAARVDHRTLAEQGIDREPELHLGPQLVAIERRTGQPSRVRLERERAAAHRRQLDQAERAELAEAEAAAQRAAVELEMLHVQKRREDERKSVKVPAPKPMVMARKAEERRQREEAEVREYRQQMAESRAQDMGWLAAHCTGAEQVFGRVGLEVVARCGGNLSRVDWRRVEELALRMAVAEQGLDPQDVARALIEHSPLRVDPASHAEIYEQVRREAPALQDEHDRRRADGYDYDR